ncbi:hypothetical protein D6D69_00650 [Moraxella catarrhalis]|nr:hypothetical protein [Moraxella catarrhalis]OAV25392.1 hypothetical protein AO371_0749 [Moraxella catarrhalis]RKM23955.1 hypothetical protein D6D69_00650 [Moraxella catarrhalis]
MKQSCQWVKLTKLMANFYPLKSTKYWLNLLTVLTLLFMIGTILIGVFYHKWIFLGMRANFICKLIDGYDWATVPNCTNWTIYA